MVHTARSTPVVTSSRHGTRPTAAGPFGSGTLGAGSSGAGLLGAGLVASLLLSACTSTAVEPAAQQPRALPVRGAQVAQRDLDEVLIVTGTLRPRAEIKVIAEVTARLDRVVKDEGAAVGKGDLLALLDDTDYRLTLQRVKATLAVADANRAHAAAERDRANSLLKTGGITDKDHLTAQVNLQVSDASLAQARAEIAIAEQNLSRTRIVAPFAGHVADRLADAGTVLASGTPILTLVDDAVLEFRGAVPSGDYAKVTLRAPVSLTIDALPGLAVKGEVTRIIPLVQERNRSFELIARVPGRAGLVGGLFARAAIHVRTVPRALLVPPAAIIREGADPTTADLFIVNSGKVERRTVTLGVEQPDAIQIVQGVAAGDTVVIDPPVSLTSGATVQVLEQGKVAAAAPAPTPAIAPAAAPATH